MSNHEGMYHYKGAGLDNVWLRSGYEIHKTDYGMGVSIHDADELHELIAETIITNPQKLRGQEVRFLRSMFGLSQEGMARMLSISRSTIARWESDRNKEIPADADKSIRFRYMLKLVEDPKILKLIELLNELDDFEDSIPLMFEETDKGWKRGVEEYA